jgi:hypothetical protein
MLVPIAPATHKARQASKRFGFVLLLSVLACLLPLDRVPVVEVGQQCIYTSLIGSYRVCCA